LLEPGGSLAGFYKSNTQFQDHPAPSLSPVNNVFLLHRPSEAEIIQHLLDQHDTPYSYLDVGASNRALPTGFNVDHHRARLGVGELAFSRARLALTQWKMYPAPFVELCF
jgi:hypothetical protein